MLKHIVMFTMNHAEAGYELRKRLLALPQNIREIQYYEVGIHICTDDSEDATKIVLISHFQNRADLDSYRIHPAHQDLINWLHDGNMKSIQAVDYEI